MQEKRDSTHKSFLIFNLGATCRWMVIDTFRPLFPREISPAPISEKCGWETGPASCTTGIQTSKRPARSMSQYRLRHPAHLKIYKRKNYIIISSSNINSSSSNISSSSSSSSSSKSSSSSINSMSIIGIIPRNLFVSIPLPLAWVEFQLTHASGSSKQA
jgi:hypothetical protein